MGETRSDAHKVFRTFFLLSSLFAMQEFILSFVPATLRTDPTRFGELAISSKRPFSQRLLLHSTRSMGFLLPRLFASGVLLQGAAALLFAVPFCCAEEQD